MTDPNEIERIFSSRQEELKAVKKELGSYGVDAEIEKFIADRQAELDKFKAALGTEVMGAIRTSGATKTCEEIVGDVHKAIEEIKLETIRGLGLPSHYVFPETAQVILPIKATENSISDFVDIKIALDPPPAPEDAIARIKREVESSLLDFLKGNKIPFTDDGLRQVEGNVRATLKAYGASDAWYEVRAHSGSSYSVHLDLPSTIGAKPSRPNQSACPDCHGTGEYIGLITKRPCPTCQGDSK